ncbi:MAG: hypothetical protein ACR2LI_14385 [Propionibacteriaceae bacterium]
MLWVVVMAVIGLLGLLMVVGYARWLWHKVSDVMSEVTVVTDRLGQLGSLLAQIQPPESGRPGEEDAADLNDDEDDGDDEDDDWAADARALRLSTARHAFEPGRGPSDREVGDVL